MEFQQFLESELKDLQEPDLKDANGSTSPDSPNSPTTREGRAGTAPVSDLMFTNPISSTIPYNHQTNKPTLSTLVVSKGQT